MFHNDIFWLPFARWLLFLGIIFSFFPRSRTTKKYFFHNFSIFSRDPLQIYSRMELWLLSKMSKYIYSTKSHFLKYLHKDFPSPCVSVPVHAMYRATREFPLLYEDVDDLTRLFLAGKRSQSSHLVKCDYRQISWTTPSVASQKAWKWRFSRVPMNGSNAVGGWQLSR